MAGYGDDAGFTAWLTARGLTLPASSPTEAQLRQVGSDYIDGTYGDRFSGYPTEGVTQERAWPRTNAVTTSCQPIPPDVIPLAVVNASYAAAYQQATAPGSLTSSTGAEGAIKREKVGQLEVEYAGASSSASITTTAPIFSAIDGLLAPYLRPDPASFTPALVLAVGE